MSDEMYDKSDDLIPEDYCGGEYECDIGGVDISDDDEDERVWVSLGEESISVAWSALRKNGKPVNQHLSEKFNLRRKISIEERATNLLENYWHPKAFTEHQVSIVVGVLKEAGLLKEDV